LEILIETYLYILVFVFSELSTTTRSTTMLSSATVTGLFVCSVLHNMNFVVIPVSWLGTVVR